MLTHWVCYCRRLKIGCRLWAGTPVRNWLAMRPMRCHWRGLYTWSILGWMPCFLERMHGCTEYRWSCCQCKWQNSKLQSSYGLWLVNIGISVERWKYARGRLVSLLLYPVSLWCGLSIFLFNIFELTSWTKLSAHGSHHLFMGSGLIRLSGLHCHAVAKLCNNAWRIMIATEVIHVSFRKPVCLLCLMQSYAKTHLGFIRTWEKRLCGNNCVTVPTSSWNKFFSLQIMGLLS
jgi:hypothetical protein